MTAGEAMEMDARSSEVHVLRPDATVVHWEDATTRDKEDGALVVGSEAWGAVLYGVVEE